MKLEATDLTCPVCKSSVLSGPIRMMYADGAPDAKSYQCAGSDGAPCDWSLIWPNGNTPMTDVILARAIERRRP